MTERLWSFTLVMVATCCMVFCLHWNMDMADECARNSDMMASLAATSTTIRMNESPMLVGLVVNVNQLVVIDEVAETSNALLYDLGDGVCGGLVYHDGCLYNVMYRGTTLPLGSLRTPVAKADVDWQHLEIRDGVHYWKALSGPHVWSCVRVVVS